MPPLRVSDPIQLAALLRLQTASSRETLLTIDGATGAGKSFLARELARLLPAEHIEIDSFLVPQRGGYVEAVKFPELAQQVREVLAGGGPAILEGVCAEDVLDRLQLSSSFRIYSLVVDARGEPTDFELFADGESPDEVINALDAAVKLIDPTATVPRLQREVIRYHRRRQPLRIADYIVERAKAW